MTEDRKNGAPMLETTYKHLGRRLWLFMLVAGIVINAAARNVDGVAGVLMFSIGSVIVLTALYKATR